MTIYVRMTDKFMSGWGGAEGMRNVFVVECDTREQADTIEMAAERRDEMKRIEMMTEHPKARKGVIYTDKHFNDLGGAWHFGYNPEL